MVWIYNSHNMSSGASRRDLLQELDGKIKTKVSSVLNRDVKQYGKKYMFDGREDTCWNSDQGQTQTIAFQSECPISIQELNIQFQGGFAGKTCKLEIQALENDETTTVDFYPEDVNQMQIFNINDKTATRAFKIHFLGSTDFFGRIIIYQLKIMGDVIPS